MKTTGVSLKRPYPMSKSSFSKAIERYKQNIFSKDQEAVQMHKALCKKLL